MNFEILSPDGAQGEAWQALLNRLPEDERDIHFFPQYARIYRLTYGFEPVLAVAREDDAAIFQVFVRRPLTALPFLASQNIEGDFFDIANPYGYGGPVPVGDEEAAGRLYPFFDQEFTAYCAQEQIASEFCSLHPFLADKQRRLLSHGPIIPQFQKDVVYIDTSAGPGSIWRIIKARRSNVKQAQRAGVTVAKVELSPTNFALYNQLYYATMERKGAAERWYVPESFFANTAAELGDTRTSMFFASIDGQVVSAFFLIHANATAYYHFSASDNAFLEARPNDLLMYEVAEWSAGQGYRRFHLGGGVTLRPDDNLLHFKSSFSKLRAPLYTYFRIHHQPTYDRLSTLKKSYEIATLGTEVDSDFLPLYRR